MKVRELQQELLNMDPDLDVVIEVGESANYEPIHSWDYVYDENDRLEAIVLWPRY